MQSRDTQLSFDVDASAEGDATRVTVAASTGQKGTYRIASGEHADYLLFFDELAGDFGTRAPGSAEIPTTDEGDIKWRPLITSNPQNFGDPGFMPCRSRCVCGPCDVR